MTKFLVISLIFFSAYAGLICANSPELSQFTKVNSSLSFDGKEMTDSSFLKDLLPGFLPFEEFEKEFKLGALSTEQIHPLTKTLSQTMQRSMTEGLNMLLDVDEGVIQGLENFIPSINSIAPVLAEKIKKGGRVFLVGSGSSGRVAIDIAAKCNLAFPETKEQIYGMIAGGDSALIRAKEGFEDSEIDGNRALEDENLGPQDAVILISASGSASFNVGCGQFSTTKKAYVLYFYNSQNVPSRTQHLFDQSDNPVIPLCIDIGPQAIAGSTRLQAATLAEVGIGSLLVSALYLNQGKYSLAKKYPYKLILKMQEGIHLIRKHIDAIVKFVEQEKTIFLNPDSNFRQLRDITNEGYVTVIATENSIREVLIDSTEISPTFSTSPIRRESENQKKRAEFQAYLIDKENNREAWQAVLGRDIQATDVKDTDAFMIACNAQGMNSYYQRPKGKGNFLMGVFKIKECEKIPEVIMTALKIAKKENGQIGLILMCNGKLSSKQALDLHDLESEQILIFENVPFDSVGFSDTVILKQVLNLISNGSMVLMNKIHGNQMIDVRAANKKLIDRCLRLIKEIWNEYKSNGVLTRRDLYYNVAHVNVLKKGYEEKGIYTPSVVKIVLAMLSLEKTPENFQEIIDFLAEKQERIDWIGNQKQEV